MRRDRASVCAVVLAGGQSRRFGADKLGAELDGRPLLWWVLDAVSPLTAEVVVVGPAEPHDAAARRLVDGWMADRTDAGVGARPGRVVARVVPDERPFAGPLRALAVGLGSAHAPVALIVGGDMPLLSATFLGRLLDALEGRADDAADGPADGHQTRELEGGLGGGADAGGAGSRPVAAAPRIEGRLQPLPLAVRRPEVEASARRRLTSGDASIRGLVAVLQPVAFLDVGAQEPSLEDVDAPADIARLAARLRRPYGAD